MSEREHVKEIEGGSEYDWHNDSTWDPFSALYSSERDDYRGAFTRVGFWSSILVE
jgi:hypothetical protein